MSPKPEIEKNQDRENYRGIVLVDVKTRINHLTKLIREKFTWKPPTGWTMQELISSFHGEMLTKDSNATKCAVNELVKIAQRMDKKNDAYHKSMEAKADLTNNILEELATRRKPEKKGWVKMEKDGQIKI